MSYSNVLVSSEGVKEENSYHSLYRHSVDDPEGFWAEQAKRIHWHVAPQQILASDPPFQQWFVGGRTNLCFNALDRHLPERADQLALVAVSSETGKTWELTYAQLHREVNAFAAVLKLLNVGKGDRVVIYMPNMAEAVFAMLACARVGAIHSVVFGGFAARNLATRIDDSQPKLLITADAGMRGGRVIPYKPLVDQACTESESPPPKVLIVSRGLQPELAWVAGRDEDYATLRAVVGNTQVPVEWLESNEPSYILYTSGTTGKPKGVQRDVGGYAVALALSMETVFDVAPGQVMFSTSDVGWAVGHSYNVYGPLIVGATSVLYEGLPTHSDASIWWSLCEKYAVRTMFSSPTAVRVLKKFDASVIARHNLDALHYLFLAGEPLDEPTANWITGALGKPVIDNYWQTETGWPAITLHPGLEMKPVKFGSPGLPNLGYKIKVIDEHSGLPVAANQKGVLVFELPLPPGFMRTIWRNDDRYRASYFGHFKELVYSSLDWARQDEEGYTYILGRTDDVINVAGHRMGTREIEEAVSETPQVTEAAVIGVPDEIKGQVPIVFATLRTTLTDELQRREAATQIRQMVENCLGAIARPARVYIVNSLPKTRSGKLLRRLLQALTLQVDPGDLSTLDDPGALDEIRNALERGPDAGS